MAITFQLSLSVVSPCYRQHPLPVFFKNIVPPYNRQTGCNIFSFPTMLRRAGRNLAIASALCGAFTCQAQSEGIDPDSISLDYGTGNVTRLARANLQWDWGESWFDSNGTHISGYWDASLAIWDAREWNDVEGKSHTLEDIGFTPVFRFEDDSRAGWYADAGVGPNVLSRLYENRNRNFSTAFQFGDLIGVGYQSKRWSTGIIIEHFSNGAIKHPNPGANFAIFTVGYKLGTN